MTFQIWTSVTCDADGCNEVAVDQDRHARSIARRGGWALVRRSGRQLDLCPAHRPGAPQDST